MKPVVVTRTQLRPMTQTRTEAQIHQLARTDWREAIASWLRGYKPNAQNSAGYPWREFLEVLGKDPTEATTSDIMRWLDFIRTKPGVSNERGCQVAAGTLRVKWSAVRLAFDQLVMHGLIDKNPLRDLIFSRQKFKGPQKRPIPAIPADQVKKMIDAPERGTTRGIRDRAILSVLFGAALRESELRALNRGDVKRSETGRIKLRLRDTKAGGEQIATLAPWAEGALEEWLAMRRAAPVAPLFVGSRGERLCRKILVLLWRKYADAAGIEGSSPHSARVSAITDLLRAGVPHREVMKFSRHASVQMVEHYDRWDEFQDSVPTPNFSACRKPEPDHTL